MDTNTERFRLQQNGMTSAALYLPRLFLWIHSFYIVYLSIYIILINRKQIAIAPRLTWPLVYLYP